jgi:hypothetical protein
MRRRLLVAAAVSVLVLAGCGKSKPASVDAVAESTTTNPAGTIAQSGIGGDQGGTATSVVTGGTPTTGAVSGTTRPGGAAGGTGGTVAAKGAYKPTDKGTYTYHATGKDSSPGLGERPVDTDEALKVDAPTGSDQKATRTDARGGTTEQVRRFGNDGVRLVSQKITAQGVTKEFKPSSPVMVLPYPLTKGQEWSWKMTSTDNATTVDAKFKYVNDENIDVGGTSLKTYVIEATIVVSGDLKSTSKQTLWLSPDLRLSAQERDVTDGSFGQAAFHSETLRKLKSAKPS